MAFTQKIELTEEARRIIASVERLPETMVRGIIKGMDDENLLTVSQIQRQSLSFPSDGPTTPLGCRHISGRLRGSLRASRAVFSNGAVVSAIGSNVVYAAAQEFGLDQDETVAPHMRENVQRETVFGKRKNVRKADIGVRSYTRHMKLEGRGFVRRGITDRVPAYTTAISKAILEGWNNP